MIIEIIKFIKNVNPNKLLFTSNMSISIVKINVDNLKELTAISQQTFKETFADFNTTEDMELYLSTDMSQQALENEIRNLNSHFYFAYLNEILAGYLKLTDSEKDHDLEIERIYVSQSFQGKKIGLEIMNFALSHAKKMNFSKIWLGVWEHNQKAIDFYLKLGFQFTGEKQFILGKDVQRDLIMEKFTHNIILN